MKFSLVFDKSGDSIPFECVDNENLLEFFITQANHNNLNSFTDAGAISENCNRLLDEINWALIKTNEVLHTLINQNFPQSNNPTDYFDQRFLNQQHELWVFSQQNIINIDDLRFSNNSEQARLGKILHDAYSDDIREVKLAEVMIKLGYIYPYEEVNMTVHRLEYFFKKNIGFKSDQQWQVFDNPFVDNIISNNNIVNFSFGYTYVGRQYYNKWQYFDTDLEFQDHYNYETLEWAFQMNLSRPETIPYSKEFLAWCRDKNVRAITTQIPLANVVDLDKNLHHYRTILYQNSRDKNRAKIILH
jgi:hypothetical protein